MMPNIEALFIALVHQVLPVICGRLWHPFQKFGNMLPLAEGDYFISGTHDSRGYLNAIPGFFCFSPWNERWVVFAYYPFIWVSAVSIIVVCVNICLVSN